MSPRIGILECDHVDIANRTIAGDYSDMFRTLLSSVDPSVEVVTYDVSGGELPASPDECDAWLATGSRQSAYDEIDWIGALSGFIRDLRGADTSFVGICFGHQLLAQALGGGVERAPTGWGVGSHTMSFDENETWMVPEADECNLLFMHQDQVTRLPDEGVLIGSTDHCNIAMFRVGEKMLGIQAHPEFRVEYLERLLDERVARIGDEATAAARQSLATSLSNGLVARWILQFLMPVQPPLRSRR